MSDKINLHDIWPQERDYIANPERLKYLRRVVKPDKADCVFCLSHQKGMSFESLCVYKSKHSMVVLNKYPYNSGHLLIIPQQHVGDISDLSEEVYLDLSKLLKLSMEAAKSIYKCPGINVGMNHGKVAGAGIPNHLHWHIIPRWSGDTNFFPIICETKLIPESLEQTYQNYKTYFEKLSSS